MSAGAAWSVRTGAISVATPGQGFIDISARCAAWLSEIAAVEGSLTLFIRHTSASLTIQENADPSVRTDLTGALDRLAPRDAVYRHDTEGPDDMPAHIKTMLTATNLTIPVSASRMLLGTWQGIYVAEHRDRPHRREVVLQFMGRCA